MADASPLEPILEVGLRKQSAGGDDYRAGFARTQHHLPQGDFIGKHDQDPITTRDSDTPEVVCDLVRFRRQLRKTPSGLRAELVQHTQRRPVIVLRHAVKVVERPVEFIEPGPLEALICGPIIEAVAQQEITRLQKLESSHRWISGDLQSYATLMPGADA